VGNRLPAVELVEEALFAAAAEQLAENRARPATQQRAWNK